VLLVDVEMGRHETRSDPIVAMVDEHAFLLKVRRTRTGAPDRRAAAGSFGESA
jgi:hypothetical protein